MSLAYEEHYTIRDYALWEGDWELIRGAPYAMEPSPSISHQRIEQALSFQVYKQLQNYIECEALAEIDWQCADDTVVRPDMLIACNIQGEKLTKTPELIVEVVSPSSAKRDEGLKFELYQQEGVKTYILAYPEEKVAKVYRLHEGRYIKEADFTDEQFDFMIKECALNIDFSQIWRD
ncbi:Uma2 family endonuclease [Thiomicrorhabdus sp. Kp2]|uniref:Uma2 family endonuclease n=1 Tax=Thiomicrorhabdus sp. Kp2 TaxID=1123518 RepID=UPI0003FF80A1|nr:Uma2 family endonuclease [Thiomicrorhabdus sp. Kp2]